MKINLLCSDRNIPKNLFQHHNQEAWAGIDRGALILIQNQIDPVFSVGILILLIIKSVNF